MGVRACHQSLRIGERSRVLPNQTAPSGSYFAASTFSIETVSPFIVPVIITFLP